jgi:hypothetical protein
MHIMLFVVSAITFLPRLVPTVWINKPVWIKEMRPYLALLAAVVIVLCCYIRWLIKIHLQEMVRLHNSMCQNTIQDLLQMGQLQSGDLLLFAWRPINDRHQTLMLSCYSHVALVCIQPGGALCTVESHNELDPTEAWPGAQTANGPHMHPLESRIAAYPGCVYHVPLAQLCGSRDISATFETLVHAASSYPYYPAALLDTLSPALIFICATLIRCITTVRHFFACGDFVHLALVAAGLLPPEHRWWCPATPHSVLGLRTCKGEPLFDTNRMCRLVATGQTMEASAVSRSE